MNRRILVIAAPLIIGLVSTISSFAQINNTLGALKPVYGNVTPICECEALMKVTIPNTKIISAAVDAKNGACNVTAIVNHPPANDSVKVWIALPVKNWNGRFRGAGGGGFSGGNPGSLTEPVSQGFASGATNTGHEGGSGAFALNAKDARLDWQLIRDNAYLGIHDMTMVGKDLVKLFYGKPARYSYFVGGSTGGRQGLSEAQRFPEDYDGILSRFPAINWHRFVIAELWPQVVMQEEKNYIPAEKLTAANKALVLLFDGIDGRIDSVLDDPLNNAIQPQALIGKKPGESDFTLSDAAVIRKIYEGPRTHDGKFLWYGLLPGANLTTLAGTTGNPLVGNPFPISADYTRYFLYLNPNWSGSSITRTEFELLWNQSVEQYGEVFGTDNPDLTRFKNHGGKLIITHGLSDQLIFPQGSIDYYLRVQERMGGTKSTANFARLFLLPGLDHSYQGPGPRPKNEFESLIQWVEENKAPDRIVAELRDKSGNLLQSRSYSFYSKASNTRINTFK